jgi:hypothetical protein
LFDLSDLPVRLRGWLARQPTRRTLWLAGGGKLADVIRELDVRFQLGEAPSHELALTTLGTSARLLAALMGGEVRLVTSTASLVELQAADAILDPQLFLASVEPTLAGSRLPQSWDVTSDSIAARVAQHVGAHELVLLKSQLPPAGSDRAAAASGGHVDAFFPCAAAALGTVRCVNLRDAALPELVIPHG